MFDTDKIDMFGGRTEDNTKIKMLGNKKHRENEKDKLKILDITKKISIEEYKEKLNTILNNIKDSMVQEKKLVGIPVYIPLNKKQDLKGFNALYLNPETAINEFKKESEITLYRINLKENTKVLYFSNSVFYDNYNKTLPLGMDISQKCLLDFDMYKLKQINKDDFRIVNMQDELKINTIKINLYEYELEEK